MKGRLTGRGSIVVLTLAAALAAVGVGWAAIPAADGTINGCYATSNSILLGIPYSKGDTRIVDSDETCRSYEKAIAWNQKGPKGDTGPAGPAGPQGEPGPTGPAAASVWAAVAPDGTVAGSSPGVTVNKGDTGFYEVAYPDLRPDANPACAAVITLRLAANNALPPGYGNALASDDSTTVLVRDASGAVEDNGFNVAVFC